MKKQLFFLLLIGIISAFSISSCGLLEDAAEEILEEETDEILNLGWVGNEEEDLANIEDDLNFGTSDALPSSVDLTNYFPPIGDQGQYGTCVAWATGYNHFSVLNARANGYTTSDMQYDNTKIFSPKYLFWAIPSAQKGEDCGGTGFEPAYDVMLSQGIATMDKVPYESLGDCSGSVSSWSSNAASFKIESYREIEMDKQTIKSYLASGRAVSFGAKLGDNFMSANSDAVHSSDTYGYTGQHAYHAMTLSGYDDTKGPNGAFRVVNSWGKSWGDNGNIWVDQNFFVSGDFAFCAFVAKVPTSDPDNDGDNEVDNDDLSTGNDLIAWELEDVMPDSNDPTYRSVYYNVFNAGQNTIMASEDWNIVYVYYNAYDANDYGIIIYDYYTNDYSTTNGANGEFDGDGAFSWWNYVNVESGHSVAYDFAIATGGSADENTRFEYTYYMPNITGSYYLMLIADGYGTITESDEDNNYSYLAQSNGDPLEIQNGVIKSTIAKKRAVAGIPMQNQDAPNQTMKKGKNLNTYSPEEIAGFVRHQKQTGDLQAKIYEFVQNKKSTSVTKRIAK